jgi:hypothetical protein
MIHSLCELPPKPFLTQVLDKTAKLYLFLWERKDEKSRVYFSWENLSKYYHKNMFRSTLRRIVDIGLANCNESADGVDIELVGWEDIE